MCLSRLSLLLFLGAGGSSHFMLQFECCAHGGFLLREAVLYVALVGNGLGVYK